MPAQDPAQFRQRYGPWALIAGASDGTGAEYARQLAAQGLSCALAARRREPLEALASEIARDHGVETRVILQDLAQPGAADGLAKACADLEVGLFVSNAGADSNASHSLDAPLEAWRDLVARNVLTLVESAYAFAAPMKARGRGGLIFMGSGAGMGGSARVAVYSATKAFDLNFGESLWAELGPHGIDVLAVVAPGMNTPTLRRLLDSRGVQAAGLYEADDVVRRALDRLPDGPTLIFPYGQSDEQVAEAERTAKARRDRVEFSAQASKRFFGED